MICQILLDDLYEQVPPVPNFKDKGSHGKPVGNEEDPARPFERFQEFLFKTFTTLVPWCLMKKVYWKRWDTLKSQYLSEYPILIELDWNKFEK